MNQTTINRYQPGGDIYSQLAARYGVENANRIAAAAATGDRETLTNEIAIVRNGEFLNESTSMILLDQLATNPLGAPLDALNKGVNQIFNSQGVKTILTVAVVAVVIVLAVKSS
jgi:hypothetical protein